VATSKTGGVDRWLASTKNLVGSGCAILALVAQLVFGLGPLWPVVVVAAYGVGALVAPHRRVTLRLGLSLGASKADLEDQLGVLGRRLRGLDADAQAQVTTIVGTLGEILRSWDDLAVARDQRHTVEQMIGDYLPTSVQTYLDLPQTVGAGRAAAHTELMAQLALLDTESVRIRDALFAKRLDTLTGQGRFLRDKFSQSSLDLGP